MKKTWNFLLKLIIKIPGTGKIRNRLYKRLGIKFEGDAIIYNPFSVIGNYSNLELGNNASIRMGGGVCRARQNHYWS